MPMEFRGASVVVTGGCGFIGSHLVAELVSRGAVRVVVIDSLRYGDLANVAGLPGVEVIQHTLGFDPPAVLERAVSGASCLFHFAAEKHNQSKDDPARVYQSNIQGTHALLDAAARSGVKKVVYSSSLYAYGRVTGEPFVETEVPRPRTVYGITKLAGEHICEHFARTGAFDYGVVRYLFVYGPKQFAGMGYKSVIVKNFERLIAGDRPVVYGDGMQTLDYVFVDDAVEAALRVMQAPVSGEVVNIGSGRGTSVAELIDLMTSVSGRPVEKTFGPADWTAGTRRVGNVEKAASLFGWRAETPLRTGLERTFEWLSARSR